MKRNLIPFLLLGSFFSYGQVGINTTAPSATVDIVSKTAAPANKILNVQNSSATNANNLSIYEDSRSYVGKPDSVTPNETNDAIVNAFGTTTRSTLKLVAAPSTENPSTTTSRNGVDYNHLSAVYMDPNGNIVKAYDPFSAIATSASFDGTYTVPNTTAGVKIVDVTNPSLVRFDFSSGLLLGVTGIGDNVLGALTFGVNNGFVSSGFVSGTGSSTTRNPVTVTVTNNGNANIAAFTASVTYDFTNGTDLIFFYQNGSIFARNTGTGNVTINITQSRRFR